MISINLFFYWCMISPILEILIFHFMGHGSLNPPFCFFVKRWSYLHVSLSKIGFYQLLGPIGHFETLLSCVLLEIRISSHPIFTFWGIWVFLTPWQKKIFSYISYIMNSLALLFCVIYYPYSTLTHLKLDFLTSQVKIFYRA